MIAMGQLKFEILVGNKATVEAALAGYAVTKDAHSLMILGFSYDGTNYHCLVRYREKG